MNLTRLSFFTTWFAFGVILLGAFTRLTDAGLGCPDWPGCYGHWVLPSAEQALAQAQTVYPDTLIDVVKAQTEMAHRYVASFLGLCIFALGIYSFKQRHPARKLALGLCLLVLLQGAFGMWTVTLKLLPIVVLGHLLLGLTTLCLLWLYYLRAKAAEGSVNFPASLQTRSLKVLAVLTLIALIIQIFLGGWVSTNYAALACQGFPGCTAADFFPIDFSKALNFMGANHLENPLTFMDHPARMTIHMLHRCGAVVLSIMIILLGIKLISEKCTRGLGMHLYGLLALQLGLGISNILLSLPLWVAVAHNGVAALLLLSLIKIVYKLNTKGAA